MKSKDFRPLSIRLLYLRHCEGLGTLCSSFWSFVSWEICPRHHREPLFSRQIVSDVVRKFENRGIEKQSRISFRSAEVGNPYEVYEVGNRRESAKSVESRESKTSKSTFLNSVTGCVLLSRGDERSLCLDLHEQKEEKSEKIANVECFRVLENYVS